jgi:hypothetical protein
MLNLIRDLFAVVGVLAVSLMATPLIFAKFGDDPDDDF